MINPGHFGLRYPTTADAPAATSPHHSWHGGYGGRHEPPAPPYAGDPQLQQDALAAAAR